MKHHFCGSRTVLKGDVQALRRQELDTYLQKSPLLDWQVLDVLKIVPTRCGREQTKSPHAMDGAVGHKTQRYQVIVN